MLLIHGLGDEQDICKFDGSMFCFEIGQVTFPNWGSFWGY